GSWGAYARRRFEVIYFVVVVDHPSKTLMGKSIRIDMHGNSHHVGLVPMCCHHSQHISCNSAVWFAN
ncbi:hypothetical protein AA407_15955, partial [Vibrio anguillarum]|nr:hypothetical protein [Vibrio anguillarum]